MKQFRSFFTAAMLLLLAACGQLQTPQGVDAPLPAEPGLTTAAFSPTSLIVKLAVGLDAAEQQAVLDRHELSETSAIAALRLHVADVPAGSDIAQVIAALEADPDVVRVEREMLRAAEAVPADPGYVDQWALPLIGWDGVYGTVTPSGTVTLALLDTGVDAANPDLAGLLVPGYSAFGTSPTVDPNGHGTAMAGIAAAASNDLGIAGVAYAGVSLMPVQVLDGAGLGQDGDIIAGLVWAADNGARVVLMAFSNPGYSPALQDAINYAWSKGAVLVAATGNDGLEVATFPAGSAKVMGVSATTAADAPWSGSNYGPATFLAAPGVDVLATAPGTGTIAITGTSASAALVAGSAALMRAADPDASNGVIVGRLARNADAVGTLAQTGNGRLNLARAIEDTSSDAVVPGGAAPAEGGPFVGPYEAAAKNLTITFVGPALAGTITFSDFTESGSAAPCSATCTRSLHNDQTGKITVTSNTGFVFAGWSGTWDVNGGAGTTCAGATSPCTFDMANKAQALTATFTRTTTTMVARTAGSDPSIYGASVTFTATVIATPSNPSGSASITFKDGATTLCTIAVTGNTAACSTSTLPVGLRSITAQYSGSAGFSGSTSTALGHTVDPKALTVSGVTANSKTYDGTTAATLNTGSAALVGVVAGDTVTLNTVGATGTFATASVGNGKTVTVSGLTIGGTHASNYTVTQPSLTANITSAALIITASSPAPIVYGDAAPSVSPSYSGFVPGDNAGNSLTTLPTCSTAYMAGNAVGNYGTTCSGAVAPNYSVSYVAGSFTVNQKSASVTPSAANKVYGDADPAFTGTLSGFLAADNVTATYSRSAGETVAGSPYQISATLSPAGVLGNYTITYDTAAFTITQRALTVSATGVNRVYNGTTDATVTLSDDRVSGDDLTTSYTNALFLDRDVGIGKTVNVTGISISGTDAGNYTFNDTAVTTADITARPITVTAVTDTRVYDGTTGSAGVPTVTTGTLASGDTGNFTQAFANRNVGTGKTLTPAGSVSDGNGGANYLVTFQDDTTGVITPASVTGSFTAQDKVYDGTTSATIQTRSITGGVFAPDDVTLTGGSATFDTADVGTGKTVTGAGFGLGGADAGNYQLDGVDTATADITAAPLTITASSPAPIVYGDAAPSVSPSYDGFVSGDNAGNSVTTLPTCSTPYSAGDPIGSYATECSGAVAPNYDVSYLAGSFDVTPKAASVTPDAEGKVYGDADPAFSGALTGFLVADSVTASYSRSAGESVAGSPYTISATLAPAGVLGNYDITYHTAAFTIDPRALTVSANGIDKTYDGTTDATVTLSDDRVSGDVLSVTFTGASFDDANVGVDRTVTVTGISVSGADADNYTFNTTAATTADITERPITVTPDAGQGKIYGAADPALSYAITSGSLVTGDVFTGALARDAGENVGLYEITQGTLTAGSNYDLTVVGGVEFEITQRLVTVTADPQSKIYGEADPVLTYAITSGSLVTGDVFTGAPTRAAGEDVGVSAITQGTLDLGSNYDLTFIGANLTITERPVTVTADAKTKTYGNPDPAFTYEITAGTLVFSDTFTGALERDPGENVGTYAITQGSLTLGGNYDLSFVGADLTIDPRPIVVTADPQSKIYGDADPALDYDITFGSLAFSDDFTGALERAVGEGVGVYAVTQGTLDLGSNYALLFVGDDLTITERSVTVTAGAKSKTYGESDPTLTYAITSGSLAFSDDFTGSLSRVVGENVGTYAIEQGTLALSSNYVLTFVGADLTITQAPLIITASSPAAIIYGDAAPSVSLGYSGFVLGDDETDSFTTLPVCSTPYSAGDPIGSYDTECSGAVAPNYDVSYLAGSFTVHQKVASVTPDAAGKIYGGADPVLMGTLSGFLTADSVTASYSRIAGETVAGSPYTISAILSPAGVLDNYDITYNTADFTIDPKSASVAPDAAGKTYGDADPVLSGNLVGFLTADNVTATYSRTAGETVAGSPYQISAELFPTAVLSNYDIHYDTADFTIGQRLLTVSAAGVNKVYDGTTDATVELSDDRVSGDDVTTSYTAAAFDDRNVGTGKTVDVTGISISGTDAGNYTFNPTASTTADITLATVTGSFTADDKTYDGTVDADILTRSIDGGVFAPDVVTLTGGSATFDTADVGTGKTVTGTGFGLGGADAGNYQLGTVATTTADIAAAPLTITASSPAPIVYGDVAPSVSPSYSGFVPGDDADNSLTTLPICSTAYTAGNPVGPYATNCAGAVALNYDVSYVAGSFDVTRKAASVTPDVAGKIYGSADPVLTGTPTGFLLADGVSASYGRTAGETVLGGPYTISATLSPVDVLGNYDITYHTAAFSITAKPASVTPDANAKIYGSADPVLTGSLVGFLPADNVTASYSRAPGETVVGGPYVISATLSPAGVLNNYAITDNTALFAITRKAASVTPNPAGKIFGAVDPALTGSLSGFLPADNVTATYSRVAGEMVGSYPITGTLAPTGVISNYDVAHTPASFTIGAWTLQGFHSPVGISNSYNTIFPTTFVWNSAKGGSTVPLKFEVFAGGVERTSTADIRFFTATKVSCNSGAAVGEDPIPLSEMSTGNTSLSYSGGQFHQNWKTPKVSSETCYRVVVTTQDNSVLVAFFKLR